MFSERVENRYILKVCCASVKIVELFTSLVPETVNYLHVVIRV